MAVLAAPALAREDEVQVDSDRRGWIYRRLTPVSGAGEPFAPLDMQTPARVPLPDPNRLYDFEVRGRAGFFQVFRGMRPNVSAGDRFTIPTVVELDLPRVLLACLAGTALCAVGLWLAVRRRGDQARRLEEAMREAEQRLMHAESRTGDPLRIGPYRIVRRLGQGGHARVFEAEDSYGDRYALKLPERPSPRFAREWQVLKELRHPGIVRLYDFRDADPAYIVMELVDGESLAALLQRGPMPLGRVRDIGRQLAEVLAYAHGRGIVHRDLTPSNVVLVGDQVKLLDFGLALHENLATITAPEVMMGTPAYMAPEQVDGHEAEARSDLFGLGVILYELVTGRLPWTEKDPIKLYLAKCNTVPPPPGRDPALDALIMELLQADPSRRPASAAAVRERL